MKTPGKWVVGMVVGVAFATGVQAVVPGSTGQNYNAIAQRNLFGLKEPPPRQEPPPTPPPALPKVILTGLTDILGFQVAFLKVQYPAKPGEPAKEQSLTLKEGERDGDIEVVDIDLRAETVQVKNSGTLMPVTFDKLPPTPAPAPATVSNMSSNPGMVAPTVPNLATNPFSPSNLAGRRPIPTRTIRLPVPAAAQGHQPASTTPAPTVPASVPATPTTIPTTPNVPPGLTPAPGSVPNAPAYQPQYPAAAAHGNLTPEEQLILQELERQKSQPAPQ